MISYKADALAGYRRFCKAQADEWRSCATECEDGGCEDCDMDCDFLAAEWEEKLGYTDEELMDEVDSMLAGRMYQDGFGAWTDRFGAYGNDEVTLDMLELDTNRYCLDACLAFKGEWCGCEDENGLVADCDCPKPEGFYVARLWDNKYDREVKGSRYHHKVLDTAVANAIATRQ